MRGGEKLEARLREIAERLDSANTLRVGFPAGATYPDGASVPMVAAINEFGRPSVGQPPRPFMRNTIAQHGGEWPKQIAALLKSTDYDAAQTLELMGDAIQGQVMETISEFNSVPLAPSTIEKKGTSKQLVESGLMLGSVTAEVT